MLINFRDLPIGDLEGATRNFEFLQNALNPVWLQPNFANGWENFEAGGRKAEFMKDLLGFVHLRGVIKKGESTKTAFTLPAGFRPGVREEFSVLAFGNTAKIEILTSGAVTPVNEFAGAEVKTFVFLNGITFRAEL